MLPAPSARARRAGSGGRPARVLVGRGARGRKIRCVNVVAGAFRTGTRREASTDRSAVTSSFLVVSYRYLKQIAIVSCDQKNGCTDDKAFDGCRERTHKVGERQSQTEYKEPPKIQ